MNYSNIAGYPVEQYRYLGGTNPQTTYPYDSKYDAKYDPMYQLYHKKRAYPAWVQEHNPPYVFAQSFVDPKPKTYSVNVGPNNIEFNVADYPPYSYFYPNPLECEDVCGGRVCDKYYRKRNDFYNCQRCQLVQTPGPMCWSSKLQKCVKCSREEALSPCEDRYGCANANGFPHNRVEPINPKYTGCSNCF